MLDDDLVGKLKDGEAYAVYFIDYQNGTEGIIQSMERLARFNGEVLEPTLRRVFCPLRRLIIRTSK